MMRVWWSKLVKACGGRRRLADELREEIDAHLEFEIQEHISTGMTPAQAQEAARREFGNSMLIQEQARESWMFYVFETILQDLRYGLRMLFRSPALTCAALLSLALGIGANTALFGVVNAVMLRALPVWHPDQLLLLTWTSKAWPEHFVEDVEGSVDTDKTTGQMKSTALSNDTYQYLRQNNNAFSAMIAFSSNDERVNVGLGGGAQDAMLQAVSGDYFQGLGVSMILGRALAPADDRVTASLAVVVSSGFWQQRLGSDRFVVGKQIAINGKPATIVGVAAREFFGVDPGQTPDLYVPLSFQVELYRQVHEEDLRKPKVWWLTLVGRLKPGISEERAGTELKVLFHQSLPVDSASVAPDAITPSLELSPASRGLGGLREEFSTSLFLMMAMVALVLLIACANVAGLLLARATSRQREISVRLSLGAPRLRIVRQLLTESILLGVLGGAVGLLFAKWVASLLVALLAGAQRQPIALSVQPDTRVFAFTAGISILSGILFGLAPALRVRRMDVYSALRQNAGIPRSAGHRFLSGKILVGAQVALCLLLMIGAGLLVRTLWHLQQVDLGFNRDHLLLFEVQPGLNGYKAARLATYYQDLQQRIGAIPGVKSVGISQRGPVGDGWSQGRVVIPGYTPPGKGVPFYRHWVSPSYFETLEIPLVLGRVLGPGDLSSSPRAVVVNQRFVQDYLHGDNPIGRKFNTGSLKAEIVGVVGDTKYSSLRKEAPPTAYLSYLQYTPDYPASMTFEVRTKVDPAIVVAALQGKASVLDKDVPLIQIGTEMEVIGRALFLEKALALISGSFGLLALLLACVGLYGTMSYTVSRRTNEIGIRMALGAERGTILGMVLRESLLIVLAGIAAGMPLAWVGARLLESQLFGLSAHDPSTILLATAAIFAVTILAGFLPSRRASRVDPVVALRCE
jgi:putative ABC transport system permease protein